MPADPKPVKRHRDPGAGTRKLLSDPQCRACERRASDGHHIVLRSQGGDDVEDNIMPLCHDCHMAYHAGDGKLVVLARELAYVRRKLGHSAAELYLTRRRYKTKGAR